MNNKGKQVKENLAISQIIVDDLFRKKNYNLTKESSDSSNVFILYGDNGSGKTTILELIFHLLSTSDSEGHRTYLAHTIFSNFEVRFTDGTTVRAYRKKGKYIGSFTMKVTKDKELIGKAGFITDSFHRNHPC